MAVRDVIRTVIAIACVGATVAGLTNVFSDNTAEEALARQVACGPTPCSARITRMERTPFKQAFQVQVSARTAAESDSGASVDVKCQRSQILVGAYECAIVPAP